MTCAALGGPRVFCRNSACKTEASLASRRLPHRRIAFPESLLACVSLVVMPILSRAEQKDSGGHRFRLGAESCPDVEFDAKELTCEISVDARFSQVPSR